jgi:hypothetical protein
MSIFSKPPKGGDGQQKPDAQTAKVPAGAAPSNKSTQRLQPPAPVTAPAAVPAARPAPAPAPPPAQPAVVITRSIDLGAAPRTQARPSMPNMNIGPPVSPPAQPPAQAPPPALSADSSGAVPAARPSSPSSPKLQATAPVLQVGGPPPAPAPVVGAPPPPAPSSSPTLEIERQIDRPVAKTAPLQTPVQHQPEPTAASQSVRPTAPDIQLGPVDGSARVGAPRDNSASIADTFERLLSADDVDAGFARLEAKQGGGAGTVSPGDLAEVRTLFAQLAANHVRQVRDFLIDLRWSEATMDWVAICEPALKSLRRAADKLEITELCAALDAFSKTLSDAAAAGGRTIEGPQRDAILASYEGLAKLMPQAFALDLDTSQREAAILQSLLLQIPNVRKVTLDKLYAAGLTTLEAMRLANAGDIAATTGISADLSARIVAHFRAYHESARGAAHDATRTQERDKVAELTKRLRREHYEFELASQSWTHEASEKKRSLRKAREQTVLDIHVVLARLGEVERVKELEKLSFERKLAYLESFLEEAREKYVAQT